MSLLECNNLSVGYDSSVVRKDISFSVSSGDYLCIVGENGSGKSTLMKTVLGLKAPINGTISFGDGLKQNEIGYLPQQTDVQKDFPASVKEVVLSGCLSKCGFRPFYSKNEKELAKLNMQKLDIYNIKNRCYRELSGGQQQRVLLARALCATTKMLLLDEPVSGLDPKVTTQMYNLIFDINKKDKTAVIMISHDINASLKYATHILHIGENTFFGTKEEYLKTDLYFHFNTCGGNNND